MTPVTRAQHDPYIRQLRAMDLDPDHFVIFGSAPMLVHGLRSRVSDLDVVARGAVWQQVSASGMPAHGTLSGDRAWQFCCGQLQFFDRWITREWDTDTLIDNADVIDGLRYAPLAEVLRYKQELRRPKDEADIQVLRGHLRATDDALATT